MAKAKRKTLPKEFDALIEAGDLEALKAVFEICDINARGGYTKQTALAFRGCPEVLTRWLVERGADLEAADNYGETPLHAQAGYRDGGVGVLLDLGADVNSGEGSRGTPLHKAGDRGNVENARLLLAHGAHVDARNDRGQTPLVYALERCSNIQIVDRAAMAELLLGAIEPPPVPERSIVDRLFRRRSQAEPRVTSEMKALVERIGTDFEFHRSGFNPDHVEEVSAALDHLYALFDVPAVPRRAMHDGTSPIIAKARRWQDQHQELWEMLVPSSGAASTVQGEVIRISGRISDEIDRNGGVNWDDNYRAMARAFVGHVESGTPLPPAMLKEAEAIVTALKAGGGDTARLCELAVEWVGRNPKPIRLEKPDYDR
ncbi:MAG: hypothetical protein CVT77_19450 [Alphaproteobacteria bacterium HGW-Alphaproteobacteria-16]|nr:MAG: hypothetical protein CVT77_19450 [Alphaproteobacteria bacterium HGW-Alphaproteobacteria-16]